MFLLQIVPGSEAGARKALVRHYQRMPEDSPVAQLEAAFPGSESSFKVVATAEMELKLDGDSISISGIPRELLSQ